MTKQEAIDILDELLNDGMNPDTIKNCTGDYFTCPIDECLICGVMNCPGQEPLHFHHDGCPWCDSPETKLRLREL